MGKSKKQVSREPMITEDDIKSENAKIRISMFIPISLQDAYKAEAAKLGVGYQTLMQIKLREALDNPIEDRLARVEKKLFSKHG